MEIKLPRVIGHRGAAAAAPENTLAGLRKAAEEGAQWVEFDVMLSGDSVPLLHHDHDFRRTAGLAAAVAAVPFAEIARLDAGARFAPEFAGERVPRLEQALELLLALGLGANIEIKPAPGLAVATTRLALATVRRLWPQDVPPPLISSFEREALATALTAAPELPRGLLAEGLPPDWRETMSGLACASLHLSRRKLTRSLVEQVKAAGYLLAVYTVNDPAEAVRFLKWGADSIITDRPGALLQAIAEGG